MTFPVITKPEDLDVWVAHVPIGTSVTLSDGTVIDRRPLATTTNNVTTLGPPAPANNGWQQRTAHGR